MKNIKSYFKFMITALVIIALFKEAESQSTTPSNAFSGGFLGWNNTNGTNPLLFKTNRLTRMRLNGANAPGKNPFSQGYLGISPRPIAGSTTITWFDPGNPDPDNTPLSMVHLYGPNNTNFGVGSWRTWMQTGMYVNENSDNMYVGMKPNLKPSITNQSDAVIAWGDDPKDDVLRFIFTAYTSAPGIMGTLQGMELARMGASGNTGFGNYQIPVSRQAVRRVEILDADPNSLTGANQNAPQLRTTYIYNTNPALGVFTEFQTTNLGDMYFNTRSNSNPRGFGFHTNTPGNTVEINSVALNATAPGGSSGLRFTDLNSAASPTIANPGTGVLSVNANGDVILVPDQTSSGGTGTGGIGTCAVPTIFPLGQNRSIQLNGNTLYFEDGPAAGTNNVGIGVLCNTPLAGKLQVGNTNQNASILAYTVFSSTGAAYGIHSSSQGSTTNNFGAWTQATGASVQNFGTRGIATGAIGQNYGAYFSGVGGSDSYGILANASGATTNYGVWATSQGGINNRAGKFVGYLEYTVGLIGSDVKLKENIQDIQNATSNLMQLLPRNFTFKANNFPAMNLPSGTHYGLIAQEIEAVFPELVKPSYQPTTLDSAGNVIYQAIDYKCVDYMSLIPILIQGFKEQNMRMDSMTVVIASMQSTINFCCELISKAVNNTDSSSESVLASGAVLYQNHMNSNTNETTIRYFVPENAIGIMAFFDEFGNELKIVELPFKGQNAELNLSTMNLTAEVYSYSLLVNGKIADTKRMIKAK